MNGNQGYPGTRYHPQEGWIFVMEQSRAWECNMGSRGGGPVDTSDEAGKGNGGSEAKVGCNVGKEQAHTSEAWHETQQHQRSAIGPRADCLSFVLFTLLSLIQNT